MQITPLNLIMIRFYLMHPAQDKDYITQQVLLYFTFHLAVYATTRQSLRHPADLIYPSC